MPKPKQFERTLYIRVPIGTFRKIERIRKRDKKSRSDFVRNLIYKQLAHYKEI
ncbi:MAG: hypothetical protein ABIN18_23135 [Pseudomonadota bacterium]